MSDMGVFEDYEYCEYGKPVQDSDKTGIKIVYESSPCEYFAKFNEGMKKGQELSFQQEYQNVPVTAHKMDIIKSKFKKEADEPKPEPKFEVGDRIKIHYPDTTYHNRKGKITKMYCHKGKYSYDIDLEVSGKSHSLLGLSEAKLRKVSVSSQPELDFG